MTRSICISPQFLPQVIAMSLVGLLPGHASTEKIFPVDAVVDVTREPYGAKPDDALDDTAAIQRAITDNVNTGRVLYFPSGTYLLSDTLVARDRDGRWRPHLTLQGQSRENTILKLGDRLAAYGDSKKPKPILATGSFWEEGDSLDGGGNKAFRNNIFDLTFDTGKGNPGAVGVDWAVSNQGAIKDVTIRSVDGGGRAGISLLRRIPGPGLIKNVEVIGFDVGIDMGDIQYGVTLENVAVKRQKVAGVRASQNLLHIRRLQSENSVPAVLITDRNGCVTLLDSRLWGGSADQFAIDCAGSLLVRNVSCDGYRSIRWKDRPLAVPLPSEVARPDAIGSSPGMTPLPVEETPEYWNADLDRWQAVGPRREGEKDDSAAIQRAIDSGKETIYFRNDRVYFLSETVIVRGSVRQILGMGAEISLGAASEPFGDAANPRPLFRIDSDDVSAVFFENIFFNAQYPGEVLIEGNSAATLVIKHCAGWVGARGFRRTYRNAAQARGKVFLEDVFLPGWDFQGQQVWARQFNPENYDGDGNSAQVENRGGRLWILGFKTEGAAPFLKTSAGGATELLGSYNYVSAAALNPVPAEAVPYLIEDSEAALTFLSENFRPTDYSVYIRVKRGGQTFEWKGADLAPRNGTSGDRSFAVPLFRTSGLERR